MIFVAGFRLFYFNLCICTAFFQIKPFDIMYQDIRIHKLKHYGGMSLKFIQPYLGNETAMHKINH